MRLTGFVILVCSTLLMGCENDAFINKTVELKDAAWSFNDPMKISAEIEDTTGTHNFYIQLRHGGNYKYQNLIVFFKTFYPNNTYTVDTIDCPLAEPSGRWLGSGLGDILDNRILFKINHKFPQSGTYNFELQHAMRPDTIHEIYDVGLIVQRTID